MKECNNTAATEIFRHWNPRYSSTAPLRLDLHGLYVKEAERYTADHITSCRKAGVTQTTIVTGWGKHTADGVAKLKPAIEKLLRMDGNLAVQMDVPNKGCIRVQIVVGS